MMKKTDIPKVISILRRETTRFKEPCVTALSKKGPDPFKVLVSCILSLRTKDETTLASSERLFKIASTPQALSLLRIKTIERVVYPAGFYRTKARTIRDISQRLVREYDSRVPDTMDGLLSFKGVGRKTANLVLTRGFRKPGICVDTHVHRIANRWGYVRTKTPYETEMALRKKLPRRYWMVLNDLLVAYGQNTCKPVSPFCNRCRLYAYCERRGVKRHR